MELKEAIQLWKENNVFECTFTFNCGGDSMGDTEIELIDEETNVIECEELSDYFDNKVYENVEFYEKSDSHYQGESGRVRIKLKKDDDGIEEFEYVKSSSFKYSETAMETISITLTDEEVKFLKDKQVTRIGGGSDDVAVILYKEDCILTDNEFEIKKTLLEKIETEAQEHEFDVEVDEMDEWFTFNTGDIDGDDDDDSITLKGNELSLNVSRQELILILEKIKKQIL